MEEGARSEVGFAGAESAELSDDGGSVSGMSRGTASSGLDDEEDMLEVSGRLSGDLGG